MLVRPLLLAGLGPQLRYLPRHRLLRRLAHYLPGLTIVDEKRVEKALAQQVNDREEDVHFQRRGLVRVLYVTVNLKRLRVQLYHRPQEVFQKSKDRAKLLLFQDRDRQLDALVQELDQSHE